MDTDDLSRETYKAIILEAEKFNHDLTLRFGLLSYECKDESEFIGKSEILISKLRNANRSVLMDIFSDVNPDKAKLNKTLDVILDNIEKVKLIPIKKRHYDF